MEDFGCVPSCTTTHTSRSPSLRTRAAEELAGELTEAAALLCYYANSSLRTIVYGPRQIHRFFRFATLSVRMTGSRGGGKLRERILRLGFCALIAIAVADVILAQTGTAQMPRHVCSACIRAHEEFLASDALRGRGSATADELTAATYVAAQLRQYGIDPAGDDRGYIQQAAVVRRKFTGPPRLRVRNKAEPITWTYGQDFLVSFLSQTQFSGLLRKVDSDKPEPKIESGSIALILGSDRGKIRKKAMSLVSKGAAGVLVSSIAPESAGFRGRGKELPKPPAELEDQAGQRPSSKLNFLQLSADATQILARVPDGTKVSFGGPAITEKSYTRNAIGILHGTDPSLAHAAVLLSAHLDHVGVGKPVNGDSIYNGADDDASGVTAVLEFARVLGAGGKPRRTVIFALFGSEEIGVLGSIYFREHPPLPLNDIAANLEFEMLGRADPAVKADTVWLTGWERSNLGPTLAEHGAHLVADPHADQDFFRRSDNYALARKGVVAQTISSYGLHGDYHQPSDDVAHIDFDHMNTAIGSLLAPIEWLVNSDFTPKWNEGGKP
jgi:aminopeptidase YwaD